MPSTVPELPYKWKLSLWTVKGIDNVKKSYVSNLATTFYLMYSMKYRFSCEYERFNLSFASSVYSIYESVYNTIELFIVRVYTLLNSHVRGPPFVFCSVFFFPLFNFFKLKYG